MSRGTAKKARHFAADLRLESIAASRVKLLASFFTTAMTRVLFTLTVFVGSALLFLVQPMVGKLILPRFGGSPAVWNTAMVFFQATLLLGYAYAHFATKWLGIKRQAIIHLVLVALGLLLLPIALPDGAGATGEGNPAFKVLATLFVMVGLPFTLVSAGAPLIQRWFSRTSDPAASDPYFLYSASNVGSMLALLGYPFLIEPAYRLGFQANAWRYGYVALLVLMAGCAFVLWKQPDEHSAEGAEPAEKISWKQRGIWIAIAAIPSSLLIGCTTYITTVVAPIPLLWVFPLALYLATFILAFASKPLVSASALGKLAIPLVGVLVYLMAAHFTRWPLLLLGLHVFVLFVVGYACHSRLYEQRPPASRLTEFYLWISVGGVIGGAFNSLLSPLIFPWLIEYPLVLGIACIVLAWGKPNWRLAVAAWISVALVFGIVLTLYRSQHFGVSETRSLVVLAAALLTVLAFMYRPLVFGVALFGVWLAADQTGLSRAGTFLARTRSFFGAHDVTTDGMVNAMRHGTTLHGMQLIKEPWRPISYYFPTSPIGQVMSELDGHPNMKRFAVVGLGVGTMAAYGKPGQELDYYEIDPSVKAMAENPALFTFLRDSKAKVNVILGDARLELAHAPNGSYGLIVLDAFTSDAIPVHLLTKEAITMYFEKLAPGGILALHISNRYLTLGPILAAAGKDLGLYNLFQYNNQDPGDPFWNASLYFLLARKPEDFGGMLTTHKWLIVGPEKGKDAWTDDYSNILSAWGSPVR